MPLHLDGLEPGNCHSPNAATKPMRQSSADLRMNEVQMNSVRPLLKKRGDTGSNIRLALSHIIRSGDPMNGPNHLQALSADQYDNRIRIYK